MVGYHGLCNYATASSRSLSTAWAVEIARGTAYSPPPATLIHAHDHRRRALSPRADELEPPWSLAVDRAGPRCQGGPRCTATRGC